mmetsp:Transcript_16146/g.22519  ORF Transcript_16146/g.22519 Transcript_16146/m.22519 type:complete len:100 (-) Transcript_16146:857-1156(-)
MGTSLRLLNPPKAVPFQIRPVTSWKGRVEISCPEAATPITHDVPQPRWQTFCRKNRVVENVRHLFEHYETADTPKFHNQKHLPSSAVRITSTLPVQSKV